MSRNSSFPDLRLAAGLNEGGTTVLEGPPIQPETIWRALAESSGAMVLICDEQLQVQYLNRAAAIEFRLDPAKALGASLGDVFPPETADALRFVLGNVAIPSQPRTSQAYLGGRRIHLTAWLLPATSPHPEPRQYLIVACSGRHAPAPSDIILVPASGSARKYALGTLAELTDREIEVLSYIGAGLDSKTIATKLSRSLRTVEHHRSSIGRKLGVDSLAQLVKIAIDADIVAHDKSPEGARVS